MFRFLAEGGTPPPAHNNFGDNISDGVAGPLALLIIVLLAIATALLIRNMNARLRRLPDSFPDQRGRSRHSAAPDASSAEPSVPPADPTVPPAGSDPAAPSAATADPASHGAPAGPATAAGG